MCVRIALIPPEAHAPVSQPQTLLAGVAEPPETASWLIADVQRDDGFSLMLVFHRCRCEEVFPRWQGRKGSIKQ